MKRRSEDRDYEDNEGDLRSKLIKNREEPQGRGLGGDARRQDRSGYRDKQPQFDQDNQREILYFNCNMAGHHQGVCQNPPFCYNCKSSGHKV